MRRRGNAACWWLAGPAILTLIASALGSFGESAVKLYLLPG
jgi:hypothetical protein